MSTSHSAEAGPSAPSTSSSSTTPTTTASSSSSPTSSSSSPSSYPPSSSSPASSSSSHLDAHYPLLSTNATSPSLREPPGADLAPHCPPTLAEFRASEGADVRASKLRHLWSSLPKLPDIEDDSPTAAQRMRLPGQGTLAALSPERAERLHTLYQEELVRRCGESRPDARLWGGADDLEPEAGVGPEVRDQGVSWRAFRKYLWDQERQLWDMFQELDGNHDGVLDMDEMNTALVQSGVRLSGATVKDIVRLLSGSASGEYVTFPEFRDFLLMLPRRATPNEIYKFYQVHKRFSDGRGVARVDKDGDLNPSFPKAPGGPEHSTAAGFLHNYGQSESPADNLDDAIDFDDDEEVYVVDDQRHDAWRFLLAGGMAGGVSRSVTAPFDRLKIYLITSTVQPDATHKPSPLRAFHTLWSAMGQIYKEGGGVRAFWVGNGLNVVKILPESAIKFVSYEQAKRFLAKYYDGVSDPADISSSSRFIAGGLGGITAQLSIYGLETLKTRIQSETGPSKGWKEVVAVARSMYRTGGVRAFYRGLGLGLVGVFPYSAIDMGTYETLKTTYCRSTGKVEPEIYAVLSFGALSGSIGAASVYPINLLRTRLQASGSSGHPQKYTGFVDVLQQTLKHEGWRGLYKGLLPTLLKVGPAVGVSWIVYEDAKRRLGV